MTINEAFTRFPVLETERLRLREIRATDAEAFFAIKSDLEVTRRYGQEPHRSLRDTQTWIGRLHADYEHREALFWCLEPKDAATAIGGCTFWNFQPGLRCAELGYELHPSYWQQGIMAEAVRAVLAYGFDELELQRIEACPLASNTPSANLLCRLGFVYEGNLRRRVFFRGEFEDQLYFGMLKQERQPP